MAIIMQAITSTDARNQSVGLHAGAHESFNVDNPDSFTRTWFAWANSLFAELVLKALGMHGPSETVVP